MERGEVSAAGDDEFELEAAEALAGMASSSSFAGEFRGRRCRSQRAVPENTGQGKSAQHFCENTSTVVGDQDSILKTVPTFSQMYAVSHQSKISSTLRQKLTEEEREAQRLRRILANRESARQTIRRRQAMHMELMGRAAEMLEENKYLKKEKEMAMKKYNSLKHENKFLKAEKAKRKPVEPEEIHEQQLLPCPETTPSTAATAASNNLLFPCNQPSLFPFFWPSIIPPSDNSNSGPASTSEGMAAPPFHIPTWEEFYSRRGVNYSTGIAKPGTPLFILPVPWLVPLLTHSGTHESNPLSNDAQHNTSTVHQCRVHSSSATLMQEDCWQLPSHRRTRATTSDSTRITPTSNAHSSGLNFPLDGGSQLKWPQVHPRITAHDHGHAVFPTTSHMAHVSSEKTQPGSNFSRKISKDALAATEARRMRKELMKLKNIHSHDAHLL